MSTTTTTRVRSPTAGPASHDSSAILRAEVLRLQQELHQRETEIEQLHTEKATQYATLNEELMVLRKELDLTRAQNRNLEEQAKQRSVWHQEELNSLKKKLEAENLSLKERLHEKIVYERKLEDELKDAQEVKEVQAKEIEFLSAKADIAASQLNESAQAYKSQRFLDERKVKESLVHFTIEKANYVRMLQTGVHLVEQLRAFETSLVGRQSDATFRAGEDGVRAWLGSLGLSKLAPIFTAHKYVDLDTIGAMTEKDIELLKIHGGERRKILTAAADLKKTHEEWRRRGIGQLPPTTAREILNELYDWLQKFRHMFSETSEIAASHTPQNALSCSRSFIDV